MTDKEIPAAIKEILHRVARDAGRVVVLTGAGISAESGIPTFRGPEGFWRVGSVNYRPEELATFSAFSRMPLDLWGWYLHRRSACRHAQPNPAHLALVRLEEALADRFLLVTQNVDGLHLLAGSSQERCYQIHGNIHYLRCSAECGPNVWPLPDELPVEWPKDKQPEGKEIELLKCSRCDAFLRPHVLWFDECYDEERYRFESSLAAVESASLLLVIGTSGATSLPMHMVQTAASLEIPLLVVNADSSPFSQIAEASRDGAFLQGAAGSWLPLLVDCMLRRGESS
ncbi:MAG: SIR2 family NAD-dependent protein deacylase [Planctomycetota bacterium]|jgi:NAD-dependent deacetylase